MEAALLATNLVIAIVYAWILVVMVQQRKVMSQQLTEMQSTRLAAHRPVLVVREEPEGTFITNIGHGPALDGMIVMRLGGCPFLGSYCPWVLGNGLPSLSCSSRVKWESGLSPTETCLGTST
jgi:hypothetical protein